MGGAASVLARERGHTLALAALLVTLAVYGAVAESLWDLPPRLDLAIVAIPVLSAFFVAVWLALPFVRLVNPFVLLGVGAVAGVAWIALWFAGVGSVANVLKFVSYMLLGLWFISLFEELWWIALVAVAVPWVDIWSVEAGPTRYVTEEKPGLFESISVAFPVPGESGTVNIGPPDVIFFALFLAAAARWRLRVVWTWVGMIAFLALTLVIVWETAVTGLPALPAVCLGFVVPNADLLLRDVRDVVRSWRQRATESDDG